MATDLNTFIVMGRLTRTVGEDERSYSVIANGMTKAIVSIAVNRARKQGDQWVDDVSYFDIQVFGKTAENLKPFLTKGTQIAVEAHLKQDRWEKDGQKRSSISIIADHIQLCGGKEKKDEGFSANKTYPSAQAARQASAQAQAPQQQEFYPDEGFPEDIPF